MRVLSKRVLMAMALGGLTSFAQAASTTWTNTGTGDWNDSGNWSSGVPGSRFAVLGNGGTATVTSAAPTTSDIAIGYPTPNANQFATVDVQTGGSITLVGGDLDVGVRASATSSIFRVSGGTFSVSGGNVIVGDETNSRGSIFVSGGTFTDGGNLRVGATGRASFNVIGSSSTITVAGNLTTREVSGAQSVSMSWALDGGGASAVQVAGSTTIGGGGSGTALALTMSNFAPSSDIILIDSASGSPLVSGTFNNLADGASISTTFGPYYTYNWIIDYDYGVNDNDVALVFQSVVATPEPGTASLFVVGGAALSLRRRKQRQTA